MSNQMAGINKGDVVYNFHFGRMIVQGTHTDINGNKYIEADNGYYQHEWLDSHLGVTIHKANKVDPLNGVFFEGQDAILNNSEFDSNRQKSRILPIKARDMELPIKARAMDQEMIDGMKRMVDAKSLLGEQALTLSVIEKDKKEIDTIKSALSRIDSKIQELDISIKQTEGHIVALSKRVKGCEDDIEKIHKKMEEMFFDRHKAYAGQEEAIDNYTKAGEMADPEELKRRSDCAKKEAENADKRLSNLNRELTRLQDELKDKRKSLESKKAERKEKDDDRNQKNERLSILEKEQRELERELAEEINSHKKAIDCMLKIRDRLLDKNYMDLSGMKDFRDYLLHDSIWDLLEQKSEA